MYADPKLFMMPLVALAILYGLWRAEATADHGVVPAYTGTVRVQADAGIRLAAATVGIASFDAETTGQSAGN